MRQLLGDEELEQFIRSLEAPCPTSIRLNQHKVNAEVMHELESEYGIDSSSRVPWCREGYYLVSRPIFTLDPLFHGGAYYVQEASSMFISHIITQYMSEYPVSALDLCAAPGGKSTLLASALPEGSTLTANEVVPKRAKILEENMYKWGGNHVTVTNRQARFFGEMPSAFDFILCDVPCSGEGMFRKDVEAVGEWSKENVEMCWHRQRNIVSDVWDSLKPGGLMIYSTCTYNTHENEENVRWIASELGADILPCNPLPEWHIKGNLLPGADFDCCHFLPHLTRGEGFFCAVVRKHASEIQPVPMRTHRVNTNKTDKSLHCPAPTYPVDRTTALQYLRGEALHLGSDAPKGLLTITYKGLRLGEVKNIGSRANNLYPKPWRIRMQL